MSVYSYLDIFEMMKMYKDSNNVSLEFTVQGCVLVLGGLGGSYFRAFIFLGVKWQFSFGRFYENTYADFLVQVPY